MSLEEENMAVMRRYLDELWNQDNLAILEELFSPAFVGHLAGAKRPLDFAALTRQTLQTREGFPDFRVTNEAMIAAGDYVIVRNTFHGTHRGRFMGIPPTGKSATWWGIGIYRLQDGKIVERWVVLDNLGLLQQLGVAITPPQQVGT